MRPQKAGCTRSFGLSVTVPEGCTEHPWKQPGLAGARESSHPSLSWGQREQSPGVRRVQGEDAYPPDLQHHPYPMHEVLARAGSQNPLGGHGPCMLCQRGVWLLPQHGAAPGDAAVGWGFPELLCQVPQPGRCLPAGAERHGSARITPHLPEPCGKTARSCQTPLLQVPVGSPQPSYLPPAAKPPLSCSLPCTGSRAFVLFCQPHRDPRAHCRLPTQHSPAAARTGVYPGHRDGPQANTARFRKP